MSESSRFGVAPSSGCHAFPLGRIYKDRLNPMALNGNECAVDLQLTVPEQRR